MLTDSQNSPAQRLIVTMLADYQDIAPEVPSALLVDLLADLNVSSDASRTALSRLVKQGLIERSRSGRSTLYRLSDRGRRDVAETYELVFRFGTDRPWDGHWTVVAYSVTEGNDRQVRHLLRSRLKLAGFAPIYDGMWVAPRASLESARAAIGDLDVADATLFRGALELSPAATQRLTQAWETDDVEADYHAFIGRFEPLRERLAGGLVSPAEALVARADLVNAWRLFPRRDPELPESVIGRRLPRTRAQRLFHECLRGLRQTAELRFRTILDLYADLL